METLASPQYDYGHDLLLNERDVRARTAVINGSALLDRLNPGWYNRIDLTKLRLESSTHCVLGQLYSDYHVGRDRLHLSSYAAEHYGFVDACREDYAALNTAWQAQIRIRLATDRATTLPASAKLVTA